MKVFYSTLKANHYSSNPEKPGFATPQSVYHELGYDFQTLFTQSPEYRNTCATRLSLALIKSGVPIRGRMPIKKGPHQGKSFEPGAKRLADQISSPQIFGKPQIFKGAEASLLGVGLGLSGKKGVVFFWKINQGSTDHIDLIENTSTQQVCNSACFFNAKEVWFWELP